MAHTGFLNRMHQWKVTIKVKLKSFISKFVIYLSCCNYLVSNDMAWSYKHIREVYELRLIHLSESFEVVSLNIKYKARLPSFAY